MSRFGGKVRKKFGQVSEWLSCPFHGEKSKSLCVERDRYLCYGCRKQGSVEELAQVLNGSAQAEKHQPSEAGSTT